MKKKVLVAIFLAAFLVSTTGCVNKPETENTEGEEQTTATSSVTEEVGAAPTTSVKIIEEEAPLEVETGEAETTPEETEE